MALLPTDMTGILSYLFGSGTLTAAFELPYGRELEREADEVGLTLVARVINVVLVIIFLLIHW